MEPSQRIAEIQRYFAFLAQEWPTLKTDVEDRLAPRCRRCILSEAASEIRDGICQHCQQADDGALQSSASRYLDSMQTKLDELLRAHQSHGQGRYDALLLFSGGKDSAYLLHRLRNEYPNLRILAVTIDNGYFSAVAMDNARRILEHIPTDHMVFRPRGELYRKTFRHAFTHLRAGGCYETVDRMDGDLAFDIGRNLAADNGIPLMIAGMSPTQVERIFGLNSFESPRELECSNRSTSAGFELSEIYSTDEMRYWWNGGDRRSAEVPRVIYPFYAWRYDEQEVRDEVIRLGLIEPEKDNPLATNNDTIPLMLAVDVCQRGYSGFEPEFAELVREGKADRESWLAVFQSVEYLAKQGRFLPKCIADTLLRLQLTHADLQLPTGVPSIGNGVLPAIQSAGQESARCL